MSDEPNVYERIAAFEARLAAARPAESPEQMRLRADAFWKRILADAVFDPSKPFPPTAGDESATHMRMRARDKRTPRELAGDERTGKNTQ